MGIRSAEEIEGFARKILIRYFCEADVEFLISTFADDIVWLGAGEMQKAEGKEAVAACLRAGQDELSPCDMFDEVYETRNLGGGSYLCEGMSLLKSKAGTGIFLDIRQRITFIFQEREDGLKMEVDAAQNGQEAFELFEENGQDYYQAVLMDIRMPVMDGLGATRAIRGLDRPDAGRIPILAMTANAFEEDRIAAMKAGMTGYLVKPLDIEMVLDEIRKYV